MNLSIPKPKQTLVIVALILGAIALLTLANPPAAAPVALSISEDSPYPIAPELTGIAGYINTPEGFLLEDVRGKVVIVDFWTYSCINCIRTQPYLNAWYEKYADKGLVIVGVHTPEFSFEKKYENVLAAVQKENIQYPVVLDNDYATWRAYANRYWPRKYVIDAQGRIRYDHIGEGAYEETEHVIQQLLKERDDQIALEGTVSNSITPTEEGNTSLVQTPEIYLGYEFARAPLGNEEGFQPEQTVNYTLPPSLDEYAPNLVYLEGEWKNSGDYMELVSEQGKVGLYFLARHANIVAGNPTGESILIPSLDGVLISPTEAGKDLSLMNETLQTQVKDETLYSLVSQPEYADRVLTFEVQGKGFQLYTFTFG